MFANLNSKLECYFERWSGYCPSLEELNNNDVKKLAQQLKGKSEKETFTNILEWQDRNINFWFERYYIRQIIIVLLIPLVLLFIPIVFGIISLLCYCVITIAAISPVIAITVVMIKSYRKIPINQIKYVFKLNMPINILLEHRHGVCKDYAKITACLLKSIYPNSKIYFVKSPNHVATGMFSNDQLYMLDQHLPINTINGWHKRNKSELKAYILKGESLHSEPITVKPTNLDIKKLQAELTKRLNINEKVTDKKTSELVIRWKLGALYYEDDEFVNYSLVRWLKNKISDEVLDLTQIYKLDVCRTNKDVDFKIIYNIST